ncbi:hypothetical protein A2U01_0025544, partial [Trifolium medium]|nr:hypothetical protein [Trifolium medium]
VQGQGIGTGYMQRCRAQNEDGETKGLGIVASGSLEAFVSKDVAISNTL